MKTKKLKFTENTNVTLDPMGAKAKPETGNLKPALRMENTKNSKDFRRFPEISNHFWKKYEDRSGFTIYDLLSRAMAAGHLSELVRATVLSGRQDAALYVRHPPPPRLRRDRRMPDATSRRAQDAPKICLSCAGIPPTLAG